ncbi:MAG: hypothetical protein HYZ44_03620 [Bacteroidetes bacterium]|nr:hypothetical protein [Bacteroidota bacterium]
MKIKSVDSLFPPSLLIEKANEFQVPQQELQPIKELINKWIEEINSGKLSKSKEESIKYRFLQDIFHKILGFNEDHPTEWQLDPEHKSRADGTKPDAALGVFQLHENSISANVVAVVEIKDFNTDLDEKIKGTSPVEQAFSYAPKARAPWVFVSNFKEIRFYYSLSQLEFQRFELKALIDDEILTQFIIVCHKNALVHPIKSRTSKFLEMRNEYTSKKSKSNKEHIIDELYKTLKAFDGLTFIDPNRLANIYPFNILDDYVWHYESYCIFSLNPEIYSLLTNIEIQNGQIIIDRDWAKLLKIKKVTKPEEKIAFIFQTLNRSHVFQLTAIKDHKEIAERNKKPNTFGFSIRHIFRLRDEKDVGVTKKILLNENQSCDCLSCNFRSLDFKAMLKKLKTTSQNISLYELGYGNYLVSASGYKISFEYYSQIIAIWKESTSNPIEAYLAAYNLIALFNLVSYYEDGDDKKISKYIKSLDLDRMLWEELHVLNRDVKETLKDIRDGSFIHQIKKNIEEVYKELIAAKQHYERGGNYSAIGNYTSKLYHQFSLLYTYVNRNFIVADAYSEYQSIVSQIFDGLLVSHSLKRYPYRLVTFDRYILSEVILNVTTQKLEELLKEVSSLDVKTEDLIVFQGRAINFLNSFVDQGPFAPQLNRLLQEYLLNYDFNEKCGRIFGNIFLLLLKINIKKEDWDKSLVQSIINFLKVEDYLYWYHLDKLGKFLKEKGDYLTSDEILSLLKIANTKEEPGNNKYQGFIKNCCYALNKFYPNDKLNNHSVLQKAIATSTNEKGQLDNQLIYYWKVVDDKGKTIIKEAYGKSLDEQFNIDIYQRLLRNKIYSYEEKDYFFKYVGIINEVKGIGFTGFENGEPQFDNFYFYNFVLLLHQLGIPSTNEALRQIEKLSEFDKWILSPDTFDYEKFNAEWLLAIWIESFLPELKKVTELPELVKTQLKKSYDPRLAEILVKYFLL